MNAYVVFFAAVNARFANNGKCWKAGPGGKSWNDQYQHENAFDAAVREAAKQLPLTSNLGYHFDSMIKLDRADPGNTRMDTAMQYREHKEALMRAACAHGATVQFY